MLRSNVIEYTKNLDITSYNNGQRETLNPDVRAMADTVWRSYNDGCSVHLLNPETFMPQLHRLNATLQEFFKSCCVLNSVFISIFVSKSLFNLPVCTLRNEFSLSENSFRSMHTGKFNKDLVTNMEITTLLRTQQYLTFSCQYTPNDISFPPAKYANKMAINDANDA